jgi:hypothetical protein
MPVRTNSDDTMTLEDRQAHSEIDTMLRNTLGDDYDSEMRDMRIGAHHLFSTPDGQKVLGALAPLITALGPLAEVRGIRFLAEIAQMVKHTTRNGG